MKTNKVAVLYGLNLIVLAGCNGGVCSSNQSIQYTTLNYNGALASGGSTGLTGIRQVAQSNNVYITGSYVVNGNSNGTLYVGPISGGGSYYVYNYPSQSGATTAGTNVYSVDNGSSGNVGLTGTYTTVQSGPDHAFGFYYDGPVSATQDPSNWHPINYPGGDVSNTYPHSIMHGLIVGNYLSLTTGGSGFIYNIADNSYVSVQYPGSRYTSIYGVWWNGGESYTIAGGFSNESTETISYGFVADYTLSNGISSWTKYTYNNQPAAVTHFEGITTDGQTGYNLAAGSSAGGSLYASFVHVARNPNGTFNPNATWINVWYPGSDTSTADTVYQNYLLGVYKESGETALNGYVASIPSSWY